MIKKRFLSMLVLLCLTVSGAWAQEEMLQTTILSADNTSFKSGSKTFDNFATVTFSGKVFNDGDYWGWYSRAERTLTVTAAEGCTITRVKFYTTSGSAFDEEAPFEAILVDDGTIVTKVNGTSIGSYGVTKIEVYGTPTYRVTLKVGTEDATSWQGKAGTGEYQALPLKRVAAGTAVSVKYSGRKLVKSVKAKKIPTAEDKGKLICTDGHIHAYGEDAECTKARVAKIIYIGPTGHATYTHGLALALTDEGWMKWGAARDACSAKNTSTPVTGATWLLASNDQWDYMLGADGAGSYTALRDGFSSVGGSNLQLSQQGLYWSNTEHEGGEWYEAWCYVFDDGHWGYNRQINNCWARACLAFGAQETMTLNHSANNTWTLAEMPGYGVELEVEYFNITVPTANTDIYIGTTTPLINAGSTTEDGATMKYLVTATNEQPTSTDGFSAAVPTAQGRTAGTYYVWYYLDFASGDDSDISALAVEVTVKAVHVTMKRGTEDATSWQGKAGEGEYQALPLTGLEPGTAVSVKYSGTKKVKSVKAKKAAAAPALNLTSPAVGQVIGDDGKNYDYASLPGDVTAVAKICYVSGSNGLALALTDEEGSMTWNTAKTTCAAHRPAFYGGTWKLATQDDWNNMITAAGGYTALRNGFSSVGGSNMLLMGYWSSTEYEDDLGLEYAWGYDFGSGNWGGSLRDFPFCCARACLAFYKTLAEATTSDCGKVVCASGHLHDAKTAVPSECTAVGILGKVTETGHGLILSLENAPQQSFDTINERWPSVTTYAGTTLKQLPDDGALGNLTSYTTLGYTTVSNWCVAQKWDYEAIFTNLGSTSTSYDDNVNAYFETGVGGTGMYGEYWCATSRDSDFGWSFGSNFWDFHLTDWYIPSLRPVLGFGAQGSDPDPIELTSTDGKTWTLASMPYYDVELEVEYETALALSETTDNTAALTEWDGYEADVTLTRTLQTGGWNTFAAPFSTAIPSGWTVKELTSATLADGKLTLNFATATSIVAGKPYLVKVDANTDLSAAPFTGAIVSKDAQPFTSTDVDFIPTLGATTIEGNNTKAVLFLAAGNKLKNPTALPANMKGFRAYFLLKGDADSIDFGDGEATGIIAIGTDRAASTDNATYTLDGRRISKATQKGVYIVNGKKVIK